MSEEVRLNDGDATFVSTFQKICWGERTGQRFTFGFKPPKGEKFVVMLLGTAPKDAQDFDCEAALNRLGFARPRWISVDDRLPPPNVKVLACRVGKTSYPPFFAKRKNRESSPWEYLDGDRCDIHVTHWMPVPDMPSIEIIEKR